MSQIPGGHIELRKNRDGSQRAFIAGTRVRVQDIYALSEIYGKTPDAIVQALPHLTLAQVQAAMSCYFDHREEILREIKEDDQFARQPKLPRRPVPCSSE